MLLHVAEFSNKVIERTNNHKPQENWVSFLYKPWLFAINQSFCVFIYISHVKSSDKNKQGCPSGFTYSAKWLLIRQPFWNSHIDPGAAFFLRKKNIRRRTSLFFFKSSLRLVISRICYFSHRMYAVKSVETIPSSDQNYRHISVLINLYADIAFRVCSDKSLIKDSKEVSRWKL